MALLYLSKRIMNFLILGTIVLSLIIAFNKSNIVDAFLKPKDIKSGSPKRATELFKNKSYDKKIELQFVTQNIKELKQKINDIIVQKDLTSTYSKSTGNNICKLVEIPLDKYQEILLPILSSKDLVSEELVSSSKFISVSNLKQRIKSAKIFKKKIEEDLTKTRNPYSLKELQDNYQTQNKIIDTLEALIKQKEGKKNLMLAKIDISNITYKSAIIKSAVKSFAFTFLLSVIFVSVSLVIIYFILIGLTSLLRVLGIKTTSGKGSGYGSRYGYGSYRGYGSSDRYGGYYSYGKKRKIKRKYIRKPKHKSEEDETSEKKKNNGE